MTDGFTENIPRMDAPENIAVDRSARSFVIDWPGGRTDRIAFVDLRRDCPCAACVSELTGQRLLNPDTVSESIEPTAVDLAGNYALRIHWSDGHNTGLFTWPHLQRLGEQLAGPNTAVERPTPPTDSNS